MVPCNTTDCVHDRRGANTSMACKHTESNGMRGSDIKPAVPTRCSSTFEEMVSLVFDWLHLLLFFCRVFCVFFLLFARAAAAAFRTLRLASAQPFGAGGRAKPPPHRFRCTLRRPRVPGICDMLFPDSLVDDAAEEVEVVVFDEGKAHTGEGGSTTP